MPTHKGTALVTVMPEQIQSPSMTADWEEKLLLIARGEYESEAFLNEIQEMISALVQNYEKMCIRDRRLNISPHQLSDVTNSGEGEGLLFYGNVILPFVDHFPKDLELYRIMTTKLSEVSKEKEG